MQNLEPTLSNLVESLGFEWVGMEWSQNSGHSRICFYIDKQPTGITLDELTSLAKQLKTQLMVAGVNVDACDLEVSSPGIERPLFRLADFERFKGQRVKIMLRLPLSSGRRNLTGVIQSVGADLIEVDVDGELFSISHANIAKAKLAPLMNSR